MQGNKIKNGGVGPARLDEESLNDRSLVSVEVARWFQRARGGPRQHRSSRFQMLCLGLKLVALRLMRLWKLAKCVTLWQF
ncbi:hypothetical protein CCMA1212_009542 [Trichoderma ghanense]|uniref:Uncharacterized protein n=1 Tax=Trichoderma ghanense TaxID=65468 RepID=A0ABY2GSH1_9HYPO